MEGPLPLPALHPSPSDGKPVTAWYKRGVGYCCGEQHAAISLELAEEGLFMPPAEDGDEVYFSSMMEDGWVRVGVIGLGPAAKAFVFGRGIDYRAMVVKKIVGDLFDIGAVGFHTQLEAGDEMRRIHMGEVLDSL